MLKFKLRKGVQVFESTEDITLSVGVLENNIVTLDKKKMGEHQGLVNKLLSQQEVSIDQSHELYESFIQLLNMGYLFSVKDNVNERIIMLDIDENLFEQSGPFEGLEYVKLSNFLNTQEMNILSVKTDALKHQSILMNLEIAVKDYELIFIYGGFQHMDILLTLNSVFQVLSKKVIYFTYDSMSCYAAGIDPEIGTGCMQCLINHLLNKKTIKSTSYLSKELSILNPSKLFLQNIILSEIENFQIHGTSALMGNVISYLPGAYQYTFDFNRRTVLCPTCIEPYYNHFEEQNVKAMRLINSM